MDYSALSANELAIDCFQSGSELAWVEFVRRFQPLIAAVVLRVARKWGETSTQVVDDLVQDTYVKLCVERTHLLRAFKPAHKDAIYGYIKVFALNLAHDHFKSSHAKKRGGGVETSSTDCDSVTSGARQVETTAVGLERIMLLKKVQLCLGKASSGPNGDRDRRIFWLYYRVGLTASAISALPTVGLSTKGVESTILRLTRAVRREIVSRKPNSPTANTSLEGVNPENSF